MSYYPRTCTNFIEDEQMRFVSHRSQHREPRITSSQLLKYITFRKYYICPHRRHVYFHGPILAVVSLRNEQESVFGNRSQAWFWQSLKVQIKPIQPVYSLEKCCPRRQSEWENVLRTFLVKAEIKCRNNFETLSSYLFMETYNANALREKCLK